MTIIDTPVETDPIIAALQTPDSAEAIIANTHAILPLLAEEADESERLAQLSPRAARALRAAGAFQMAFPRSRGGVEMSLVQQVEVTALVSAVDGGIGWNVGVLNATGYYAGRLSDEAYAELYPSRDMPTSGAFHPRGRAERVEGGYLVSGDWGWGSGSYTAEHIIGGAEVFENGEPVLGADGKQLHLGFWLPREAIDVKHDWQVLGVRGSGSTSYSIPAPGAFVPERYSFDREAADTGDGDPLDKSVGVSHVALTGVALGVARHAVDLAAEYIGYRMQSAPSKVDAATRQALGEAMGEVDFAYAGVREVCRLTDEVLFAPGATLTDVQRARMTAANAVAGSALRRVLNLCTELAAASYILDRNEIQRVVRDGLGALAHAGTRRMHLGALATAAMMHPEQGRTVADEAGWAAGAK